MQSTGWPIAVDVAFSVCLSVCLLDTTMSPSETAEPIEMSFGLWSPGPKEQCGGSVAWIPPPSWKGHFWGLCPYLPTVVILNLICQSATLMHLIAASLL